MTAGIASSFAGQNAAGRARTVGARSSSAVQVKRDSRRGHGTVLKQATGVNQMNRVNRLSLYVVGCVTLWLPQLALAQPNATTPAAITTPDRVETRIGTLEFKDGAPSAATVQRVQDNLDFVRGVDAFMNSFSGASAYALRQGFQSIGAEDNSVILFSELMDSNSLFLTPNADTVYSLAIVDLSKGPMVIEVPPRALGTLNDMWFGWIIDIGGPGPDRGEGGRYLILPPGYDGPLPDSGFHVGKSRTNHVLYAVRAFMENNDPKPAVATIKQHLKIYPYTPGGYGTSIATALEGKVRLAANPPVPPTKFVEASGKAFNTIPPNDLGYFKMVNELVQLEPATSGNVELLGQLAAIGIVKGKPFNPDARMQKILTEAAAVGNAASRALNWRASDVPGWAYYPGSAWTNMLWEGGFNFETPPPTITREGFKPLPATGARTLNSRTAFYYGYTMDSPGMIMRVPERGLAVPHRVHRRRQELLRRCQDLQGDPAAEHPGGRVLVADRLRQPDALDAADAAALPARRQPDLSDPRRGGERRRLDHRLLRPLQTSRRQGGQLDPDDAGQGLVDDPAAVQPEGALFHQGMAAERGRAGEVGHSSTAERSARAR